MNSLCNLPDVLEIAGIKETELGGLLLFVLLRRREGFFFPSVFGGRKGTHDILEDYLTLAHLPACRRTCSRTDQRVATAQRHPAAPLAAVAGTEK